MLPEQRESNTKIAASEPVAVTPLRFHSKLNRTHLIVFVLLFAGIGIVTLLRSFAATGSLRPQGTYTNWQWPTTAPQQHTSLETNLAIEADPTQVHASYGYYWASQFGMVENGGYMGIQTNGQAGSYTGKVAIFALFGATQGVENGSVGSNCTIVQNNFDGGPSQSAGSTCRLPLNWQAGDVYRLRVAVVASDNTTRTWQATVINTKTGQQQVIGKIKTTISYGLLKPWVSNWTEYYSSGRDSCEMPYSSVVFGSPKFSDSFYPSSHQNNITDGGCVSKITDNTNVVRHEQGNRNSVVPALPTGGTYISDMNWTSATTGYGAITKDQSVNNNGTPINLGGKTYAKGLGVHAISDIRYNLGGNYSKFVSHVNLQYGAGGKVSYEVWADGTKLFDSGPMDGLSITKAINVDITSKKELKLIVTDAGDGIGSDWAAWADARLIANTTTAADTTPPSVPSGLASSSQTSNSVNLTWNASTDNVGVTGYRIYRSDKGLAYIATVTGNSYSDTGLAPNTAYSYNVTAIDAAGNSSQFSNTVNVTTSAPPPLIVAEGDTVLPIVNVTAPANNSKVGYVTYVTATASDNKGVTKMEVYVDGRLVSSTTTGSINYSWVSYYAPAGVHNITVKAYDAAGNVGQGSVSVNR